MGLDVFMQYSPNFHLSNAFEKMREEAVNKVWDEVMAGRKWVDLTENDKTRARILAAAAEEAVRTENPGIPETVTIEEPSAKYPEHLFKIGYFRSSYNGAGYNHVLANRGLMDIYELFNANHDGLMEGEEYATDWQGAKKNLERQLELMRDDPEQAWKSQYYIINEHLNTPIDEEKAIDVAWKEYVHHTTVNHGIDFDRYMNKDGFFSFAKPLQVVAILTGKYLGQPSHLLIAKAEKEPGDEGDWYLQATEIMLETVEWVLAKPDPQNYRLGYSG